MPFVSYEAHRIHPANFFRLSKDKGAGGDMILSLIALSSSLPLSAIAFSLRRR